jgi:O-acetyl-ADP-ribose deacetylase (regulator of RNase III)
LQAQRRLQLIEYLLKERQDLRNMQVPQTEQGQKRLLRSLLNVRMPSPVTDEFLHTESAYLKEELAQKGITDIKDLTPIEDDIYLWKGDITTLRVDGIVNAANSQLLGCFYPCHGCIDNAIHTYAGVELRQECNRIMQAQGHQEPTGKAKITPAYNLPSKYILHTVGPIVRGMLTKKQVDLLASCYQSCLDLAQENGLNSLAFCCISTGEFGFPKKKAASIAVKTVREWKKQTGSSMQIIFNVFDEENYGIYRANFN